MDGLHYSTFLPGTQLANHLMTIKENYIIKISSYWLFRTRQWPCKTDLKTFESKLPSLQLVLSVICIHLICSQEKIRLFFWTIVTQSC